MKMTKPIFEQHCSNKTNKGYLYIIKLSDESESFYKIGITSNEDISIRIKQLISESKSQYRVEIIHAFSHPCSNLIMDIERKLLSLEEKYTPNKMFAGYSECVKDIKKALEFIKSLDWIKDFENHESVEKLNFLKILKFFGKITNFSKIVKEYAMAKEMCSFGTIAHTEGELIRAKEIVHEIENNPAMITIVEYVDEFGTEVALSYVDGSTNLSEKVLMRKLIKNEENKLLEKVISQNFKVGDIIKASEAKDILQQVYNDNVVLAKGTPNHFSLAFKVKKSTVLEDGKRINVLKLQQKH